MRRYPPTPRDVRKAVAPGLGARASRNTPTPPSPQWGREIRSLFVSSVGEPEDAGQVKHAEQGQKRKSCGIHSDTRSRGLSYRYRGATRIRGNPCHPGPAGGPGGRVLTSRGGGLVPHILVVRSDGERGKGRPAGRPDGRAPRLDSHLAEQQFVRLPGRRGEAAVEGGAGCPRPRSSIEPGQPGELSGAAVVFG